MSPLLIDWLNQENDLILGSGSPRRASLLEQAGISFRVLKSNAPEDYPETTAATEVATFLAQKKAKDLHAALEKENSLLVTADTTVVLGGDVLNKPNSAEEAKEMLTRLSGRPHIVITGVALLRKRWEAPLYFKESTVVHFQRLEKEEIDHYVNQYLPMDKAGAYGIQEWIGLVGIRGIEGDYFNVVGLPVQRLCQEIKSIWKDEQQ